MRCLILGKNGQLGNAFAERLPLHFETISLGKNDLNVLDLDKIREVLRAIQPDLLINASAYTAVDRAESEIDLATTINALAPRVMAEEMERLNGGLIHFSTDYVFDGKSKDTNSEADIPAPINVYGASKLYGEYLIQQVQSRFLIFRTSWVYARNGDNFVTRVLKWARENDEISIVSDQIGNPTCARDLAGWVTKVLLGADGNLSNYLADYRGIYHCAGKGAVSRYELAKEILETVSSLNPRIVPVTSDKFPTKAQRPQNSSLNVALFEKTFGIPIPSWQESLWRELGQSSCV